VSYDDELAVLLAKKAAALFTLRECAAFYRRSAKVAPRGTGMDAHLSTLGAHVENAASRLENQADPHLPDEVIELLEVARTARAVVT
jgi:hypothetical protein